MRLQLLSKLRDVGGGKVPKDGDIVDWANATVAAAGAEQTISSFKDASIGSGCVRAWAHVPAHTHASVAHSVCDQRAGLQVSPRAHTHARMHARG